MTLRPAIGRGTKWQVLGGLFVPFSGELTRLPPGRAPLDRNFGKCKSLFPKGLRHCRSSAKSSLGGSLAAVRAMANCSICARYEFRRAVCLESLCAEEHWDWCVIRNHFDA
jgi:hypothetical protein